jgi:hypothetical protein
VAGADPGEALYAELWRTSAAIVCGFLPPTAHRGATAGAGAAPSPGDVIAHAVEYRDPTRSSSPTPASAKMPSVSTAYLRAAQHVIDHLPRW